MSEKLELNNLLLKYNKVMEELKESVTDNLGKILLETIQRSPEITLIEWVGYTPGFNDGDICEFRMYSDPHECEFSKETQEVNTTINSLCNIISEIPDEIYKNVYNSYGFKLVLTQSSFSVEDYDCGY